MKFYFVIFSLLLQFYVFSETGSIIGEAIDLDTHQPLVGANIIIEETEIGTACDNMGRFIITNIPAGSYTISASMIGYKKIFRTNVNINSNRQAPLRFLLAPVDIEGDVVNVKARYFEKAKDAIVSTQTIDRTEIRSDPVGVYDIQMMVHSHPSVVTNTDQNNEIIVRGGAPSENLFVIDNLEIPNPNHFGRVGTGGGPINIINTEFVERVDFYAGGYPARYGDKQSSVMDINLREGSYSNYETDFEVSMAGIGILLEGPFLNNKGSFISSFRKSFIEDLIKSAGLTSVPKYSNMQHKFTYNLNTKSKLIFNFIGAIDNININDENRPDLLGAENVDFSGYQYTYGLTYKSLYSKKGYCLLSLGKTLSSWDASVFKYTNASVDTFFVRDNMESDEYLKFDIVYKHRSNIEFSAGLNIKYGKYSMIESLDSDPIYQYTYSSLDVLGIDLNQYDNYDEFVDKNPLYVDLINDYTKSDNALFIIPEYKNNNNGGLFKYSVYNQIKYSLRPFIIMIGFRYDYIPYNNTSKVSPRLGLTYSLSRKTKLNMAIGEYYQTPDYWKFLNPNNIQVLKNSYTDQVIVGIEHLLADDTKFSIEIFNKKAFNRPVLSSDITNSNFEGLFDDFGGDVGFVDVGEGETNGIEFFLQKKFSSKWHGTISYSYIDSKAKDYREINYGYYPWDFDNKHSLTIVGGYKIKFDQKKWYEQMKGKTIFKYISFIPIVPSDQFEISFRYRYADGLPYTPKIYDFNVRRWYIDSSDELNSERNSYYSRLDIMLLRRFNFKKFNLTAFLDIQNIFNRNNEWQRVYYDDGTYEMSYQYKQLPVAGMIVEF